MFKMRNNTKIAFLISLCFLCSIANAQLKHYRLAQIPIGNSDFNGFATIDKDLFSIDIGNGLTADVYLKFQSNPDAEPKAFGMFWSMPFVEARLVQKSKGRYYFYPPNNGLYPFILNPNKPKDCDSFYRSLGTKRLTLKIFKDGRARIERVSDPECFYEFKNSRLTRFKPAKVHDEFRIMYDYKGNPLCVRNNSTKKNAIEFFYKDGLVVSIKVGDDEKRSYKLSYTSCNSLNAQFQGTNLKTISAITFPDGEITSFNYNKSKDSRRNILLNGGKTILSAIVKINRIEMNDSGVSSWIDWESQTGFIVADSGGEYSVKNPFLDPHHPDHKNNSIAAIRNRWGETMNSTISYKSHEKKYPEIWGYDRNGAIKIVQNSNTGIKRRTSYIGAPGPAYMKSRKVEKMLPGESSWCEEIFRVYDADGRILREVQPNSLSLFTYDENNVQIRENYSNGRLLSKHISKNGTLTKSIYFVKDGRVKESIYGKKDGLNFIELFENGKFIESKSYYKNWDENTIAYSKSSDGTESFYKYTKYGVDILTKSVDGKEILKAFDPNISKILNFTLSDDISKWKEN